MAFDYFCCFHSYREKIKNLSDQKVGRLIRALLHYSKTGETPKLSGGERIAFDFIAYDIDAAKECHAEKCAKNRENAGKAAEDPAAQLGEKISRTVEACHIRHDGSTGTF